MKKPALYRNHSFLLSSSILLVYAQFIFLDPSTVGRQQKGFPDLAQDFEHLFRVFVAQLRSAHHIPSLDKGIKSFFEFVAMGGPGGWLGGSASQLPW